MGSTVLFGKLVWGEEPLNRKTDVDLKKHHCLPSLNFGNQIFQITKLNKELLYVAKTDSFAYYIAILLLLSANDFGDLSESYLMRFF